MRWFWNTLALAVGLVIAAWWVPQLLRTPLTAMAQQSVDEPLRGEISAPAFPEDLDWLNTGGERLTLEQLRGKVVLLDFWTYGCINCIHIIPDLKRLEAKYGDQLVVIGVHSAKFEHEGRTDSIRRLVLRYELEHPVVNDNEFEIWRAYGARAWPTLVLIDPAGQIVGGVSGEGHFELLDNLIARLIETFDAEGAIDRTPLALELETERLADTPLLYPGKVLADPVRDRLFIADTNHHRIVVTDLEGRVQTVIGGPDKGWEDGDFKAARFFMPHGLTLADANTLYVADTENHVIRRVDLDSGQVTTVAGTGEQVYQREGWGPGLELGINSPWDVLALGEWVYIAMAGQHQLWRYRPEDGHLEEFAGTRREELKDGLRLRGGLNQPSGLATDGKQVYFADSEASAVRSVGTGDDGRLETLVGVGLFDFGDVDGVGNAVRLQHPKDVAWWSRDDGDRIIIADTYNGKLKLLDPESREVSTISASVGVLDEPGGVSVVGNRAWIADTNHHAIRVLDLEAGQMQRVTISDPEGLL